MFDVPIKSPPMRSVPSAVVETQGAVSHVSPSNQSHETDATAKQEPIGTAAFMRQLSIQKPVPELVTTMKGLAARPVRGW